jgi:hypothetical protein
MVADTTPFLEMLGVWVGAGTTLFSGLATIGAVWIALTLQRRAERRNMPSVVVEYDSESSYDNKYLAPSAAGGGPDTQRQELWLRLRLMNNSNHPAKDVELRFIATQIAPNGRRDNKPAWWFKVSNLDAVSVTIPPHFPQAFDIAYLVHDIQSGELTSFLAITRPNMDEWTLEKNKIEKMGEYTNFGVGRPYMVYFAVVGGNIDPKYYRMPIQFCHPAKKPPSQQKIRESVFKECVVAGPPVEIRPEEAFPGTNAVVQVDE